MAETERPTAFVTWAHRASDWTAEQTEEWLRTVHRFAAALREAGVDADVDLFHQHDDEVDWTRYGTLAIEHADTTIIAISRAWRERWEGSNSPLEGAGAAREADFLHGRFDADQQHFQKTVKLVVLPGADDQDIPADLRRVTRFYITDFTQDGMEDLLRTLYGSPRYLLPPLGPVPDLPPELPTEDRPEDGWHGLPVAIEPIGTRLDRTPDALGGPVLELQLQPHGPVRNLPTARLRDLVGDLESTLKASLPPLSPLGGRSGDDWSIRNWVEAETVSVLADPLIRAAGLGVSPDFLRYLDVYRDRTVVAAMRLRRDSISAKVDDRSLQRITTELITTATGLDVCPDDVVPLLRLGPLHSVSPGDPNTLQGGSSSATLPWAFGGESHATTPGTDSISLGYLRAHVAKVAAELVAQLVAGLPRY
ncbi:SEFIR domain-containing protein [Amycolatopsis plumensis]|uniref:SEFIR domain-containing protein n=1 Tax=Amycolatopsis plumensis TaxID=236508 RepID=A0ABV5UAA7_9PSEU